MYSRNKKSVRSNKIIFYIINTCTVFILVIFSSHTSWANDNEPTNNKELQYKEALSEVEKAYGKYHFLLMNKLRDLATFYFKDERYDEAEPLFQRVLFIAEEEFGTYHLQVARSLNDLAATHVELDQYSKAKPLMEQALSIRKNELGERHTAVATTLYNMSFIYKEEGLNKEAEEALEKALDVYKGETGETYKRKYALAALYLGHMHYNKEDYTKAESLYEQALERFVNIGHHFAETARKSLENVRKEQSNTN